MALPSCDKTPAERFARRNALMVTLRERWPGLFPAGAPWAIGIFRQLRQALECNKKDLGFVLSAWSSQERYLKLLAPGVVRRNLDGTEAGEPTAEQRTFAGREAGGDQGDGVSGRKGPDIVSEQMALFPEIAGLGLRDRVEDACVRPIGRRRAGRYHKRSFRPRRPAAAVLLIELRQLLERQHDELMDELRRLGRQRRS